MKATEPLILLAGSGEESTNLLRRALQHASLVANIAVARDSQDALDFVFRRGPHAARPFDDPVRLILLEVELPGLGGMEVLKQVKSDPRTKIIPTVIWTFSDDPELAMKAYRLGTNSCFRKSPDAEQFKASLGVAVRYWLTVNRPASCASIGKRAGQQ